MSGCLFALSVLFFLIGIVQLFAPERGRRAGSPGESAFPFGGIPRPPSLDPGIHLPRSSTVPANAGPSPAAKQGGKTMERFPQKLGWIQVGQRIYVQHPVKGELMAHVLGRIVYSELWQQSRGPQSPWVPTGNVFLGFWLEGSLFLLHWQNRFYLLDEAVDLSDADIQTYFAPHARKFAQSDQTAEVYFSYPPAMWKIDDIGKFRVDETEGEGLRFRPGATGRFIHSSGDSGRALVVEDYEGGGGGQDTAWVGYQVQEEGIKQA